MQGYVCDGIAASIKNKYLFSRISKSNAPLRLAFKYKINTKYLYRYVSIMCNRIMYFESYKCLFTWMPTINVYFMILTIVVGKYYENMFWLIIMYTIKTVPYVTDNEVAVITL